MEQTSATEVAAQEQAQPGALAGLIKYFAGYFEIFKSRTRTAAIVGVVAYFLAKFNINLDQAAATDAVVGVANQVSSSMTPQDLIVVAIGAAVTYYHANQKVKVVEKTS